MYNAILRSSANHTKCSRWWKSRAEVNDLDKFNANSMSTVTGSGCRKVTVKEVAGRGLRRAEWVETLYDILLEGFSRLTKVKFSTALLAIIARDIILAPTKFAVKFGPTYVDPADDIKVIDKIKTHWVQTFMGCCVTLEDKYKYSDELDLH